MPAKKIMRHASGRKAHRQSLKRRHQNVQLRSRLRSLSKSVLAAVQEKNAATAKTALKAAQALWNKAAHKGVIHRNAAARQVSRLSARVAALAKP